MKLDLAELIDQTFAKLGIKKGKSLDIENLNLDSLENRKAFVLNRLARVVYSLARDHVEMPNMHKVGYAFRMYLEILSNYKPEAFKTFKKEFLSGFNDPRHDSVKFESSMAGELSEK